MDKYSQIFANVTEQLNKDDKGKCIRLGALKRTHMIFENYPVRDGTFIIHRMITIVKGRVL